MLQETTGFTTTRSGVEWVWARVIGGVVGAVGNNPMITHIKVSGMVGALRPAGVRSLTEVDTSTTLEAGRGGERAELVGQD